MQNINSFSKDAVFFDAGTGRGIGVECRVTDINGNSLFKKNYKNFKLNEFGNIVFGKDFTNNFGELMGCILALKYCLVHNIKNIYGDSELIIKYWTKGFYHPEKLPEHTVNAIQEVIKLYNEFSQKGGILTYIPGDINPADIGFHRKKY